MAIFVKEQQFEI